MSLSVNNQREIFVYLAAICLPICACCFMFWGPDIGSELLLLVGIVGTVALLIIAVAAPEAFIVVMLATKPFIDLTWNHPFFSFGGFSASALHVVGFCVLVVAGYLYFIRNDGRTIFNERVIWLFLLINLSTGFVAVFFDGRPIFAFLEIIVKLFDSYLIYFIGHRFLQDDKAKLRIIGLIWISTLMVGVLSLIQYRTGTFEIDYSQGVQRFAGFYSDPGTPSYNAIISLVFGALYIEILRKRQQLIPSIVHAAFALTVLVSAYMLKITVTKSALLMLIVFLIMWYGSYKRMAYLVIPLIIIGGVYIYSTSEAIQSRLAPEVEFLAEGEHSMEQARSMGTGRVAYWEAVLVQYIEDYDLFQKLIGNSRTFGAHNQYLAYLMQVGLVGLAVFLIMLLRFYRQLILLFREFRQPEIYMALVLLTLFAVYGLTGHPFEYTTLLWYLMILLSFINVYAFGPTLETTSEF